MENNLALSFYEYPESKFLIDKLETEIIKELRPILNIDHKNPRTPFKIQLLKLRKNCAKMAMKSLVITDMKIEPQISKKVQEMSSIDDIFIHNITESDVKSRIIRIKSEYKIMFPSEKLGNPISYPLNFKVDNIEFIANYTIGSKDEKLRSGILRLGDKIYNDILKIRNHTNLKITKSKGNSYLIERMKIE